MKEIKAVEIEINSNCNRSCSYCPNVNQQRIETGEISKELFNKIIDELSSINYSGRISFSFYNEPLLSKNIEYFSKVTKTKLQKSNLVIYSNGTLLTKEKLYLLLDAGVDFFIITRHESEDNYEFEKTLNELPLSISKKHIKFQSHLDLKLTNRGGLIKNQKDTPLPHSSPCLIPLHMITITNKGTVVPCFEDYHQVNSMGNISDQGLMEIWNSNEYVSFRKNLIMGNRQNYKVCASCNRTEVLGIF